MVINNLFKEDINVSRISNIWSILFIFHDNSMLSDYEESEENLNSNNCKKNNRSKNSNKNNPFDLLDNYNNEFDFSSFFIINFTR